MSWDQIRGHDAVRQRFERAFDLGRLGQSYLFVGPEGIGKRRFADELAKVLLCEQRTTRFAACSSCPACKLCDAGTHPDVKAFQKREDKTVFTVDVIDEDVHPFIYLKSTRGSRKVAILEGCDEINEDAANKFLKTLEEPPAGCLLILLSTSTETQLQTILSRCQVVRFNPLSTDDVMAVLQSQGVNDPQLADRVARISGGSPGLAMTLADPAIWTFRETLIGAVTASPFRASALIESWLRFIEDAGKESVQKRKRACQTITLAIQFLRRALRLAVGSDSAGLTGNDGKLAAEWTGKIGPDGIIAILDACERSNDRINGQVPFPIVIESLADRFARPSVV
ncbi:MAG: DNA polymerase III subunit [Gemmataceae bacterium]